MVSFLTCFEILHEGFCFLNTSYIEGLHAVLIREETNFLYMKTSNVTVTTKKWIVAFR